MERALPCPAGGYCRASIPTSEDQAMADQQSGAGETAREMREHEREARERDPDERSPDGDTSGSGEATDPASEPAQVEGGAAAPP